MTVKASPKTVKLAKVKKAKQTVAPLSVKKAQGTKSFKKAGGAKQLTVNAKTGKVTVKKGLAAPFVIGSGFIEDNWGSYTIDKERNLLKFNK